MTYAQNFIFDPRSYTESSNNLMVYIGYNVSVASVSNAFLYKNIQ